MNEQQLEEKLTLLDHLQSSCTHCGLCSEACATFQLSGWEHESPRGRLQLAGQFLHGRIPSESPALTTFDRCLGCQACEPLCPHQVPYRQVRQLVQELRGNLQQSVSSSMTHSHYQKWITLAYRIGHTLWRRYGGKWLKIPQFNLQSKGSFVRTNQSSLKGQSVLVICCIQDLWQHEVIEQTLTFIKRLGYSLAIDKKQPCCGAIFERLIHGGEETVCYPQERQRALSLQERTLKSFLKWLPSKTYFLAKGCQSFINKHTQQAGDLYQWIEGILNQQKLKLYFPESREVYYQPYCGSEQQQEDSIWRMLQCIEGVTIRYFAQPKSCCGGFCGEVVLHPEHAQALVGQKLSNLPLGATVIVTSPDCWSVFKKCLEPEQALTLLYPIQLLAQALIKN